MLQHTPQAEVRISMNRTARYTAICLLCLGHEAQKQQRPRQSQFTLAGSFFVLLNRKESITTGGLNLPPMQGWRCVLLSFHASYVYRVSDL